jgi:hypothetical protein
MRSISSQKDSLPRTRPHSRSRLAKIVVKWQENRQNYRVMRHEHPEQITTTVREEFGIILHDGKALFSAFRH